MKKMKISALFLALTLLLALPLAACKSAPAPGGGGATGTPTGGQTPTQTAPAPSGGLSGIFESAGNGTLTFSGNNFTLAVTGEMMGLTGTGDLNVQGTFTLTGDTVTLTFDQAKLRAGMIALIKEYAQSMGQPITDEEVNTQVDTFLSGSDNPFKVDMTGTFDSAANTVTIQDAVYTKGGGTTTPTQNPTQTPPAPDGTLTGVFTEPEGASLTFSGNAVEMRAPAATTGLDQDVVLTGTYTLQGDTVTFNISKEDNTEALKPVIKKALEQQGETNITDEMINQALDEMWSNDGFSGLTGTYDSAAGTITLNDTVYTLATD